MATLFNVAGTVSQEMEPGIDAARVVVVPRGHGYSVAATTGTIVAALAANSAVFAMRLDPGSPYRAFIERVRLEFTTIVAFTVPVTAGRKLALYRGSGAAASGGSAIPAAVQKHSTAPASEFNTAQGGDIRIATTAALTVTGITFETVQFKECSLAHVGAAGGYKEVVYDFGVTENQPIQLEPGQLIAIRNPTVFDAAGTWQLQVTVDWVEAPVLDYA